MIFIYFYIFFLDNGYILIICGNFDIYVGFCFIYWVLFIVSGIVDGEC